MTRSQWVVSKATLPLLKAEHVCNESMSMGHLVREGGGRGGGGGAVTWRAIAATPTRPESSFLEWIGSVVPYSQDGSGDGPTSFTFSL